jgi:hypothetical protein
MLVDLLDPFHGVVVSPLQSILEWLEPGIQLQNA